MYPAKRQYPRCKIFFQRRKCRKEAGAIYDACHYCLGASKGKILGCSCDKNKTEIRKKFIGVLVDVQDKVEIKTLKIDPHGKSLGPATQKEPLDTLGNRNEERTDSCDDLKDLKVDDESAEMLTRKDNLKFVIKEEPIEFQDKETGKQNTRKEPVQNLAFSEGLGTNTCDTFHNFVIKKEPIEMLQSHGKFEIDSIRGCLDHVIKKEPFDDHMIKVEPVQMLAYNEGLGTDSCGNCFESFTSKDGKTCSPCTIKEEPIERDDELEVIQSHQKLGIENSELVIKNEQCETFTSHSHSDTRMNDDFSPLVVKKEAVEMLAVLSDDWHRDTSIRMRTVTDNKCFDLVNKDHCQTWVSTGSETKNCEASRWNLDTSGNSSSDSASCLPSTSSAACSPYHSTSEDEMEQDQPLAQGYVKIANNYQICLDSAQKKMVRKRKSQHVYACQLCDATFASSYWRSQHQQRHWLTMQSFACRFCSERFGSRQSRALHEKNHTAELPSDSKDTSLHEGMNPLEEGYVVCRSLDFGNSDEKTTVKVNPFDPLINLKVGKFSSSYPQKASSSYSKTEPEFVIPDSQGKLDNTSEPQRVPKASISDSQGKLDNTSEPQRVPKASTSDSPGKLNNTSEPQLVPKASKSDSQTTPKVGISDLQTITLIETFDSQTIPTVGTSSMVGTSNSQTIMKDETLESQIVPILRTSNSQTTLLLGSSDSQTIPMVETTDSQPMLPARTSDSEMQEVTISYSDVGHPISKTTYWCKDCKRMFKDTNIQFHRWTVSKDVFCPSCKKTFNTPKDKNKHFCSQMLCADCGQIFKSGRDLLLHESKHLASRTPYKCSFCNETFVCISLRNFHNLTEHVYTHDLKFRRLLPKKILCEEENVATDRGLKLVPSKNNYRKRGPVKQDLCLNPKVNLTKQIDLCRRKIGQGSKPVLNLRKLLYNF